VDPDGNVYMTGEYSGATATFFGSIEIDDSGGGGFAVKYDRDGTVQWAKSVAVTGVGTGIATSGSSLVYVFVAGLPSSIIKLNTADGSVVDTWNFSDLFQDGRTRVSVDGSGNVIISGTFFGTVDFDPGGAVSNLVADGPTDGFIAKYTGTGGLLWARKLTSTGGDGVTNHSLSAGGDVYFSGSVEDAATIDVATANAGQVVGRLDPSGNALWMRNTTSNFSGFPLDLYADGIGVDENGDYYVYGAGFPGGGDIGGFPIPASNHFHVVRYNSVGDVVYAKFVTAAASPVFPEAIAVLGPDLYNVVGGMVDECVFDASTLADINGNPRLGLFSAQVGDVTVPALASLATAQASPDRVRLTWYVAGLEGAAFVERQRGADEWVVLGEAVRRGPDVVVYEDRDVAPGERLTYRLLWREGDEELRSGAVQIVVPHAIRQIALTAAPNPTSEAFDARIEVRGPGEAVLALHDALGREVRSRSVHVDGAGRMVVRLGTAELPAGLYWLSLRHGGDTARTRVSIVR